MIVSLGSLERESELYFVSFDEAGVSVAEVIVGCNSKLARGEVIDALGKDAKTVVVSKARPGFGKFEVVRNRDEKLWI